jgi:hypothetical protein
MKYKIVKERTAVLLEKKGQQLMNEGWIPLGGLACLRMTGNYAWWAQAFALED